VPEDTSTEPENLRSSLEELEATADQLHADNEHLRNRIKELTSIMESQMDDLVEAEHERDQLRQDVSKLIRSPKTRLFAPLHSIRIALRQRQRHG
jgi:uncharacterized coiled-coil DUF342 family protein|tara:strand:- start:138 stop:422 length:285 start_codon:yes stop_codon:yes gene_type:complete